MSDVVIKGENLSKQYRLGLVGAGTLREDLVGLWYKMRGKQDPYLAMAETNDQSSAGGNDYVWALKDVNFSVKQGEVLGIIGKNGAGKSTLLKLLSRVTAPTTGTIKAKGRIASLLEVGTGFHPELTGKENVYLNGAIMGMRRSEITRKLDEIVDFAGVQRYLNTPVKRYSSGMYVRLAFAVAAHLEPEILIIDEVLAVGDAEFQKKALGKMQDVAKGEGRTVLFVSHNMLAVENLCSRAMFLDKGRVAFEGDTNEVVERYHAGVEHETTEVSYSKSDAPGIEQAKVLYAKVGSANDESHINLNTRIRITYRFWLSKNIERVNVSMNLYNLRGVHVLNSMSETIRVSETEIEFSTEIPEALLNDGKYTIDMMLVKDRTNMIHNFKGLLSFFVVDKREPGEIYFGNIGGVVRSKLNWTHRQA